MAAPRPAQPGSGEATPSSLQSTPRMMRSTSRIPSQARWRFNSNPKDAMKWLLSEGAATLDGGGQFTAVEIAEWMLESDGVSAKAIGEWLGGPSELQGSVLKEFSRMLELGPMPFDRALRAFLSRFKLPGEAQIIDRIMQAFADAWVAGGAGGGTDESLTAETACAAAP